ncbi:MAG: lipopolysaccharide heptosyltransferase I, partial [Methylococcales bacterium]
MKVLIVKTSSMGDLIHTLPALTDACRENPGIRFDWVAERAFTEIASWHSAVERVIPIDLRSWKHRPFSRQTLREIVVALKGLQFQRYDWIIDAQGLVKSALVTGLAHGRSAGMSWTSCKEGLASLAYRKRFVILKEAHAIDRLRELFAKVLNYRYDAARLDYGWTQREWVDAGIEKPYLVFLHASSKERKCWHNAEWVDAARLAQHAG